ncbi:hypothetical protein D3C86_1984530 [compost metagenome]
MGCGNGEKSECFCMKDRLQLFTMHCYLKRQQKSQDLGLNLKNYAIAVKSAKEWGGSIARMSKVNPILRSLSIQETVVKSSFSYKMRHLFIVD